MGGKGLTEHDRFSVRAHLLHGVDHYSAVSASSKRMRRTQIEGRSVALVGVNSIGDVKHTLNNSNRLTIITVCFDFSAGDRAGRNNKRIKYGARELARTA